MKSIKAKVHLIVLFILITSFGFGTLTVNKSREIQKLMEGKAENLAIHAEIEKLNPKTRNNKEELKKIMEYKRKLPMGNHRYALNNLIQAYSIDRPKIYENRIKEFQRMQNSFMEISDWKIKNYKQWTEFYLLLSILFPLMGLFALIHYVKKGVLLPLESLSKRMTEFLIDQYTFQFSSPPNNEIGSLERTFNSLAQKVLHNIDQLHTLDQAKSEFVNIASHELRTPLTSIKGSLGLLSNNIVGQLDSEAREMVLVAENETDRLVRIINDMLDLAKIESRSLTLKKDWHSLKELFSKTIQSLQGFAWSAKVHLEIKPSTENYEVLMDGDRIQQVLTNLISNAIKYSPHGGTVTLDHKPISEASVEISVTDQGQGVSEENKRLIFEKFRQATDSSNHLVKGTGLGLAISKALIEEHDGKIGVRSQPEQGSVFYFTLHHWRQASSSPNFEKMAA